MPSTGVLAPDFTVSVEIRDICDFFLTYPQFRTSKRDFNGTLQRSKIGSEREVLIDG